MRDIGRGIAGTIDSVMTAENTPAHVQISRAGEAIASASARDLGRATGSIVGNTALLAAPIAAAGKLDAIRSLRAAELRPTFEPPQIGWVKENLGKDSAAKRYNDAATGARPGHAPTLTRTMPDGSKRSVKFDGVEAGYVIDRKYKVVTAPNARAQLLRQSEVLAQNRLIGTWEVPNQKQLIKAQRFLQRMNVKNIKMRIVKP